MGARREFEAHLSALEDDEFDALAADRFSAAALDEVLSRHDGTATVRAQRTSESITLDGRLDEPVYTRLPHLTGFLQQEPKLDPSKTVLGNVEEGVAEIKALLDQYDAINMRLGEDLSPEEMDKVLAEQGRLQDRIDAVNAWDIDSQLELAMDALRCPPPDADVTTLSGGERRRVEIDGCRGRGDRFVGPDVCDGPGCRSLAFAHRPRRPRCPGDRRRFSTADFAAWCWRAIPRDKCPGFPAFRNIACAAWTARRCLAIARSLT